jgi:hypothetical protein
MLTDILQTIIIPFGVRVLLALLVFVVGRWLARYFRRLVAASLQKTSLTASFVTLITALTYYVTWIVIGYCRSCPGHLFASIPGRPGCDNYLSVVQAF